MLSYMQWSNWELIMLGISSLILISFLPILNHTFNHVNKVIDKGDSNNNKGEIHES
jgi:hypothetical protein